MRIRALRWSIALVLAVGAATAGVSAHHSSLRAVLQDITRSSASHVQAGAAAGLSTADVTRTHARVPAIDAAPGPAMVLVVAVAFVAAAARRRQRMSVAVHERRQSRAPPMWS